MRPYNILYIHSSDELYGADRSLLRLVSQLDRSRFRPLVLLSSDLPYLGELSAALRAREIETLRLPMGVLRRQYMSSRGLMHLGRLLLSSALLIRDLIRRRGIDLVHSNTTAVWSGALAARLAGVPHVWHVREIITQPRWMNSVISGMVGQLSDRIIAVSRPVAEHLLLSQPARDRIRVIYNGLDPSPFNAVDELRAASRAALGWDDSLTGVGMVGRVSSWKGQDVFVEAAGIVARRYPQARFLMVGGGIPGEQAQSAALAQRAAALGLGAALTISDYQSSVAPILAALDLFVLPSKRPDPFPTVVLEAMAARLPVVATGHGGALEQVSDGATGLLVDPDSAEALAAGIIEALSDPQRLRSWGRAGRQRLDERFTVARHIEQVASVYAEALGG